MHEYIEIFELHKCFAIYGNNPGWMKRKNIKKRSIDDYSMLNSPSSEFLHRLNILSLPSSIPRDLTSFPVFVKRSARLLDVAAIYLRD